MRKLILIITLPLLLTSCGYKQLSLLDIAQLMQAQACQGNIDGFFSYIDKTAVKDNLRQQAFNKLTSELPVDKMGSIGTSIIEGVVASALPLIMSELWGFLTTELEKGQDGLLCKVALAPSRSGKDTIRVTFADSVSMDWGFKHESGNIWKMISIEDPTLLEGLFAQLPQIFLN